MAYLSLEDTLMHIKEVQQTNLWFCEIKPNSAMGAETPEHVKFRCQTITFPTQEWTANDIEINRYTITQPARLKRNGEMDLKFIDAIDADSEKWFERLSFALWSQNESKTDGASLGWFNIKSEVFLTLLDSTTKVNTRGYYIQHAILQPQAPEGELGSEDGIMNLTLKVKYNWWKFQPKS